MPAGCDQFLVSAASRLRNSHADPIQPGHHHRARPARHRTRAPVAQEGSGHSSLDPDRPARLLETRVGSGPEHVRRRLQRPRHAARTTACSRWASSGGRSCRRGRARWCSTSPSPVRSDPGSSRSIRATNPGRPRRTSTIRPAPPAPSLSSPDIGSRRRGVHLHPDGHARARRPHRALPVRRQRSTRSSRLVCWRPVSDLSSPPSTASRWASVAEPAESITEVKVAGRGGVPATQSPSPSTSPRSGRRNRFHHRLSRAAKRSRLRRL